MKKLLSLLTVSVLGATSITNVTAFSQAKTTYQNFNSGTASDTKMSLTIQLNKSGWDNLLAYKSCFTYENKWGFGAYLLQYADDNEFHHTWGNSYMPNFPNAVAFAKKNIIENYFGHFGRWNDCKSAVAAACFKRDVFTHLWYWQLRFVHVTNGIVFSLSATWNQHYSINYPTFRLL